MTKSRSSLLASAHPAGPGKRAVKRSSGSSYANLILLMQEIEMLDNQEQPLLIDTSTAVTSNTVNVSELHHAVDDPDGSQFSKLPSTSTSSQLLPLMLAATSQFSDDADDAGQFKELGNRQHDSSPSTDSLLTASNRSKDVTASASAADVSTRPGMNAGRSKSKRLT